MTLIIKKKKKSTLIWFEKKRNFFHFHLRIFHEIFTYFLQITSKKFDPLAVEEKKRIKSLRKLCVAKNGNRKEESIISEKIFENCLRFIFLFSWLHSPISVSAGTKLRETIHENQIYHWKHNTKSLWKTRSIFLQTKLEKK